MRACLRSVAAGCYNSSCDPVEVSPRSSRYVGRVVVSGVNGLGIRGAAMSAVSSARLESVADCDRWLAVLRVSVRRGSEVDRELARLSVDEVLDRRLELRRDQSRSGAQS